VIADQQMADRQGAGPTERGAAQPIERDPRADEGVPFLHENPTGRRAATEVM